MRQAWPIPASFLSQTILQHQHLQYTPQLRLLVPSLVANWGSCAKKTRMLLMEELTVAWARGCGAQAAHPVLAHWMAASLAV